MSSFSPLACTPEWAVEKSSEFAVFSPVLNLLEVILSWEIFKNNCDYIQFLLYLLTLQPTSIFLIITTSFFAVSFIMNVRTMLQIFLPDKMVCTVYNSIVYLLVFLTLLKLLTSNKLKIASRNIRGRGKGNLSSCKSKSDLQEIKNNWNSLFYILICTVSQLEQNIPKVWKPQNSIHWLQLLPLAYIILYRGSFAIWEGYYSKYTFL